MGIARKPEMSKAFSAQRQLGFIPRISRRSRFYWLQVLIDNRVALISVFLILGISAGAVLAPWLDLVDPLEVDSMNRLLPPSEQHWLGTDHIGRDVFARVVFGARVSLLIAISVTGGAGVIGTALGLVAAFFGRLDNVIMRIMDGLLAFPGILLALAIIASLGARPINVVIALVIVNVPRVARLARGAALTIKEELYVEAARAIGLTDLKIVGRYILPNILSPLIVQFTFITAIAIIAEASLSFLGAGVPPQIPTWGNMLRDGQRVITHAWWMSVFPGTALFLTVLAFNVIGDGLRDALDPQLSDG